MQTILVRAPQWLGDAVVSTVFLTRLKSRNPESLITVLAPSSLFELFKTHPSVHSVISFTKTESITSIAKNIRAMKASKIFILPRSFRTALEAWWGRVPERWGFRGDGRSFLLNHPVSYNSHLKYPHRYLNLINEESLPLETVSPHFPVIEPSQDKSELFSFFREHQGKILGMGPVSIAPSRTWDRANFTEVARRFLQQKSGAVVLFGSGSEYEELEKIKNDVRGPILNTAGQLSLGELGWAIQKCSRMLVNDSGLMHVASCFNIPTVVVFGASDPAWAIPSWGSFRAIQKKDIWCVPCLRNTCVRIGDSRNECLKSVSIEEVLDALAN